MKITSIYSYKDLNKHHRRLINSGISKEQSDAIISVIKEVENNKKSDLVTKSDVKEILFKVEKMELKLIIKLGAISAFWSSMILALIKIG